MSAERFGAQVVRAEGRGGPTRNALKVRDDGGTGPLTHGSGRMGPKDPAGISGFISQLVGKAVDPIGKAEIRATNRIV